MLRSVPIGKESESLWAETVTWRPSECLKWRWLLTVRILTNPSASERGRIRGRKRHAAGSNTQHDGGRFNGGDESIRRDLFTLPDQLFHDNLEHVPDIFQGFFSRVTPARGSGGVRRGTAERDETNLRGKGGHHVRTH